MSIKCIVMLLGMCSGLSFAQEVKPRTDEPVKQPATKVPSQDQLEKDLTERLTNAVMTGKFSMGDNDKGAPKQDKYSIVSAKKLENDNWLIISRIQFGEKDVTLPIVIPIKWAGDTAIITVTDFGFPGLGTYTARVMIFKDHYAGWWEGKNHGGHMWGKIEKAPAPADKPESGTTATEKNAAGKPAEPTQPASKE